MNILITGGTGFVGSHMIDFILRYAIKPDQKIYCTKRWMEDTKNVDHIDDDRFRSVSYTHLRAHETMANLLFRLLL